MENPTFSALARSSPGAEDVLAWVLDAPLLIDACGDAAGMPDWARSTVVRSTGAVTAAAVAMARSPTEVRGVWQHVDMPCSYAMLLFVKLRVIGSTVDVPRRSLL